MNALWMLAWILAGLGVVFAVLGAVAAWLESRPDVLPEPSRDARRSSFDEWA